MKPDGPEAGGFTPGHRSLAFFQGNPARTQAKTGLSGQLYWEAPAVNGSVDSFQKFGSPVTRNQFHTSRKFLIKKIQQPTVKLGTIELLV